MWMFVLSVLFVVKHCITCLHYRTVRACLWAVSSAGPLLCIHLLSWDQLVGDCMVSHLNGGCKRGKKAFLDLSLVFMIETFSSLPVDFSTAVITCIRGGIEGRVQTKIGQWWGPSAVEGSFPVELLWMACTVGEWEFVIVLEHVSLLCEMWAASYKAHM